MKTENQAVIGPIGSGFDQFVKVYASSLPELVDFDNSKASNIIYNTVRADYGAEWWNVPDACKAKDQHLTALVHGLKNRGGDKKVYLTTEPCFALLDGNKVGVLPIPSDIVVKLKEEAKTKVLPVPTTIGTAMHLYNSYRALFMANNIRYFNTVSEAYQFLQVEQAYAV